MIKRDCIGISLIGGESKRMGFDKGFINYHGYEQAYYIYHLLEKLCNRTFISCNKTQLSKLNKQYNIIVDEIDNIGPIGGLYSVMKKFHKDCFLVACDYPMLTFEVLEELYKQSESNQSSIILLKNIDSGFSIPVIGYYKKECLQIIEECIQNKQYALKSLSENLKTSYWLFHQNNEVDSIDTYKEYQLYQSSHEKH